jgi:hypothetical protein
MIGIDFTHVESLSIPLSLSISLNASKRSSYLLSIVTTRFSGATGGAEVVVEDDGPSRSGKCGVVESEAFGRLDDDSSSSLVFPSVNWSAFRFLLCAQDVDSVAVHSVFFFFFFQKTYRFLQVLCVNLIHSISVITLIVRVNFLRATLHNGGTSHGEQQKKKTEKKKGKHAALTSSLSFDALIGAVFRVSGNLHDTTFVSISK